MKDIFLVDADDTILDFHGVSEIALKEAFKEIGIPWEDKYLTEYKLINEGLWQALERKELTRSELMSRRFHVYFAHLGMEEVDAAKFNESYIKTLSTKPKYIEGAEAFLKELCNMGRVYIVTNGTGYIQKSRFSICKLYEKATDVFISEAAGVDKPDKGYTEYVTARIENFDQDKAVWIGDSLSADIQAANDAKITSIWFNPSGKKRSGKAVPDYEAADFQEILGILQQINGN